ncbi:MAG TPA: diacylglycerol kinase [Nitrospiraceae bacterium]|nr:diacylglycerol kinase [Nitrospiraceae bacterium]
MKPKSWIQSANLAIEGIIYAVRTQRHMRYHLVAAVIALIASLVLHVSRIEFILLALVIVLVLVTEAINTAIEVTIDMISEAYHPLAKRAKDIAAGGVVLASVGALTLAYFILYPAFTKAVARGLWRVRKAPYDVIAFVSLAVVIIIVIIIKALLGKGDPLRGGMPSGHAAVSFSIWVAVLFLSGSVPIIVLTFMLAAMVSWSRWSSGIHRPAEVATGVLIGASVTALLFFFFR